MRKKLLAKNTVASLSSQITALVCGFILPRFFLQYYGSEVNGLVNSITQFLGVISFLELGVGAVVQSSLYKPLVDKNDRQISCVIASTNKFFKHLAIILLIYIVILLLVYPIIVNQNFGYIYTAILIAAISISSFAQYYFGITNSLLLNADQRGYIQYNTQTVTMILNTLICAWLISDGESVQLVKLISSLIYLVRPFVLCVYVNRHYQINWKVKYSEEPIKQKWNGVAQHVAAVILDGTDTIVLTVFSTLLDVSIYSVYFLVIKGVKTLLLSVTSGIQSLFGELWAKQELKKLNIFFDWMEWLIHTGTTYVFACTAVLITPFIRIYTLDITDANYIRPFFAILLTLANAMHCLRLPYNIMVLAAGHYRQTQKNYIIAACLNIVVSVLAVNIWGLIGVAIGTLVAMIYQTIWLAFYNSKNFIYWPMKNVFKQFLVDAISIVLVLILAGRLELTKISYVNWIILAFKVALIAIFVAYSVNLIFYTNKIRKIVKKIRFYIQIQRKY